VALRAGANRAPWDLERPFSPSALSASAMLAHGSSEYNRCASRRVLASEPPGRPIPPRDLSAPALSARIFAGEPVRLPLPGGKEAVDSALGYAAQQRAGFAFTGQWHGEHLVLGTDPIASARPDHDDPFALLDEVPQTSLGLASFGGGWVGYLGYRVANLIEPRLGLPTRGRLPSFGLGLYDHVVLYDRRAGRWWFEAFWTKQRDLDLSAARERWARVLRNPSQAADTRSRLPLAFRPSPPAIQHRQSVAKGIAYVEAGDVFQVNLGLHLEAEAAVSALDLFLPAWRELNPRFGALLSYGWGGIASFSPELMLYCQAGQVRTEPIKGTIARQGDWEEQERARRALLDSEKDRAENLMIVDLMRNDLGRVCQTGSVKVPHLARVEAHPGVWHLVSRITGRLETGISTGDLLRAVFPYGSVTGAPKVRALEIINELEGTPREVYTGSIGYVSPLAGMEWSVAIRTFEVAEGRVRLGAGGGIVADSEPDAEVAECLTKAAPLVAAVGGRILE
jgi:para-aminobenzoate synthetase / 4-amino-4-deoxychorismate lyase